MKHLTIFTAITILLISCSDNQKKIEKEKPDYESSLKFLEWPKDSLNMDSITLNNFKNSGALENSLKEGMWIEYSLDSTLKGKETSVYLGNKIMTFPSQDIILKHTGSYTKGNRNGKWFTYKLRTVPTLLWDRHSVVNYNENLKHGEEIIYQGFGKDQSQYLIRNWTNGVENGIGKIYDINFPYKIRKLYTAINGRLWIKETYYADGSLNSKITDTLLLGKSLKFSKQYYANGHLQSTAFYNDTLLEGKYSYFHDNGKLWTERIYKQGKLLEVLNNFDRLGKKGNPGTLKNGNGRLYLYNEEGRIVESIEYVDGMPKEGSR